MKNLNNNKINKEFALKHSLKILVVDDVKPNLLVVSSLLKRMGYQPICVDGGIQALDLLNEETVDLIFMDIRMPGLDGMDTTRRIRQNNTMCASYSAPVRVIALTADMLHATEEKCLEAGMDDYLTKPLKADILTNILEKHHEILTQSAD